jgi:hypothetical protein
MSGLAVATALAALAPLAVLRPVARAETAPGNTNPQVTTWQTLAPDNIHTGPVLRLVREHDGTVVVLKVRQHTNKGDVVSTLDNRPTRFLYRLRPQTAAILMVTAPFPPGDNERLVAVSHQGRILSLDRFSGMEGFFSGRCQIMYTLPRSFWAQVSEFRPQVRQA